MKPGHIPLFALPASPVVQQINPLSYRAPDPGKDLVESLLAHRQRSQAQTFLENSVMWQQRTLPMAAPLVGAVLQTGGRLAVRRGAIWVLDKAGKALDVVGRIGAAIELYDFIQWVGNRDVPNKPTVEYQPGRNTFVFTLPGGGGYKEVHAYDMIDTN